MTDPTGGAESRGPDPAEPAGACPRARSRAAGGRAGRAAARRRLRRRPVGTGRRPRRRPAAAGRVQARAVPARRCRGRAGAGHRSTRISRPASSPSSSTRSCWGSSSVVHLDRAGRVLLGVLLSGGDLRALIVASVLLGAASLVGRAVYFVWGWTNPAMRASLGQKVLEPGDGERRRRRHAHPRRRPSGAGRSCTASSPSPRALQLALSGTVARRSSARSSACSPSATAIYLLYTTSPEPQAPGLPRRPGRHRGGQARRLTAPTILAAQSERGRHRRPRFPDSPTARSRGSARGAAGTPRAAAGRTQATRRIAEPLRGGDEQRVREPRPVLGRLAHQLGRPREVLRRRRHEADRARDERLEDRLASPPRPARAGAAGPAPRGRGRPAAAARRRARTRRRPPGG